MSCSANEPRTRLPAVAAIRERGHLDQQDPDDVAPAGADRLTRGEFPGPIDAARDHQVDHVRGTRDREEQTGGERAERQHAQLAGHRGGERPHGHGDAWRRDGAERRLRGFGRDAGCESRHAGDVGGSARRRNDRVVKRGRRQRLRASRRPRRRKEERRREQRHDLDVARLVERERSSDEIGGCGAQGVGQRAVEDGQRTNRLAATIGPRTRRMKWDAEDVEQVGRDGHGTDDGRAARGLHAVLDRLAVGGHAGEEIGARLPVLERRDAGTGLDGAARESARTSVSRPGSRYGRARSRKGSASANIVDVMPMPSPMTATIVSVAPGTGPERAPRVGGVEPQSIHGESLHPARRPLRDCGHMVP